jgi:hypothetical protein
MKVLTRSRYGAAQTALGGLDPIASGLPRSCGRGRPFLMEQADNNRLRYYKGGLAKRNPSTWSHGMADYACG